MINHKSKFLMSDLTDQSRKNFLPFLCGLKHTAIFSSSINVRETFSAAEVAIKIMTFIQYENLCLSSHALLGARAVLQSTAVVVLLMKWN